MAKIDFRQPVTVKYTLIAFIVLAIISSAATFWLGKEFITKESESITQLATDLKKLRDDIDKIELVKLQMKKFDDVNQILQQISANRKDNRHQEKIIQTLHEYARKSGLEIQTINFIVAAIGGKAANNSANSINVTINFSRSINYNNLLTFIKYTEVGLPRMQITDITISRIESDNKEGGQNNVSTGSIQIKIYAK